MNEPREKDWPRKCGAIAHPSIHPEQPECAREAGHDGPHGAMAFIRWENES
jgi:hypothetical protein